ncbi:DUF2087 domain-containing protein [Paenibacillus sp. WLX2291]|uniref:DUF2087 domain-containing protein n=1 Tax=Paenibacillus sp. WLX2291 TaxID=3296934 RepID=UPI003983FC78
MNEANNRQSNDLSRLTVHVSTQTTNESTHVPNISKQTSDTSISKSSASAKQQQNQNESSIMPMQETATLVDDRYTMTQQENESILKRYFKDGLDGRLSEFPRKEKRKIIILRHLLQRFQRGRQYTEQEVNERLAAAFDDYATLRRYLIIYGFMDRQEDGRAYWVKE